ncbi:hypothetical protein ACFE04_019029 [Oxalis oulophora]
MENSKDEEKAINLTNTLKKGGLRTMPFIISNEALEKVSNFGLLANMILYLVNEYHMSYATGTSVLLMWGAMSNFFPIFGAFISDSYFGRFHVIVWATVITFMGMIFLWITAIFPQARPPHCVMFREKCNSATPPQLALLFFSFLLMSIGAGGIRPCSMAFGADQFHNPKNPDNDKVLQTFFNWYYASIGVSIMISSTVIVYIQGVSSWSVGFGVPVGLMLISTVTFMLGSPLYVKLKADKSMFSDLVQVINVAWKKRHLKLQNDKCHYYHLEGSKLVAPTTKIRFLNKACVIENPDNELDSDGLAIDPTNLCTVKQVEELKALIKVLPMWSTGITIALTLSNHSIPVLQARTMDRQFIGKLKIPPASYGVSAIIVLTIWVTIYDRILVPHLSKITKLPRGLSLKQRMGIGLGISCLATAVAGIVENKRRSLAILEGLENIPDGVVSMSAYWLLPQFCLVGLAEAFNVIGQIEFYYSQFPKNMSSIAIALFTLGFGFGMLGGSLLVQIVHKVSERGGKLGWLPDNLNQGRYDNYYLLLTILSLTNFLYFIGCSWAYGDSEESMVWDEIEASTDEVSNKISIHN